MQGDFLVAIEQRPIANALPPPVEGHSPDGFIDLLKEIQAVRNQLNYSTPGYYAVIDILFNDYLRGQPVTLDTIPNPITDAFKGSDNPIRV